MDGELRIRIAGSNPKRLLIDQLAEAIEEGRVRCRDRDPGQIRLQPKCCKFFGGMRKQIDADADRLDLGRRLKNPAWNSSAMQRQPQRQSADAGPDDNDVVHCPLPARAFRRLPR